MWQSFSAPFSRYFHISLSLKQFAFYSSSRFPFHYTAFRFQFQFKRNYLLTSNATRNHQTRFLTLPSLSPPSRRLLNSRSPKRRPETWCRERFHSQNKNSKPKRELQFIISSFFFPFGMMWETSERMRPSFCEGPLNETFSIRHFNEEINQNIFLLSNRRE